MSEYNNPLYDEEIETLEEENTDSTEKTSDNTERYLRLIEEQNRRIEELESKTKESPAKKELSEEEQEELAEKLRERFYSNPVELFNEIKREAVEEAKREMEHAKKEFDDFKRSQDLDVEIKNVSNKHTDFFEYQEQMTKILDDRPEIANLPNSLETLYYIAKGMSNKPMNMNEIVKNEKVKNEIIKNYVNEKNQPNAKLMGNQPRGNYANNIPEKITSISQGGKMFRDYLRQQGLI
jgi:vacuolar-type H+-ATPase subunit I/STV1